MTNAELIIACTLDDTLVRERIHEWTQLVASAESVERLERGIRLQFARGGPTRAADVAALAEAERDCCPSFTFRSTIDEGGLDLVVEAPSDARPLVDVLLGLDGRDA